MVGNPKYVDVGQLSCFGHGAVAVGQSATDHLHDRDAHFYLVATFTNKCRKIDISGYFYGQCR